ncbi:hypothetical protein HII12_001578 [Brettanomyces bruxellensis]|uniref:NAD-dependent protein deacetylase n=1 Tax=Dekkera bruxellensis TaxID=5007 RepID=A0A8H6EXC2_DEKBR|nr:hypothetical protein HII12_001578 [Brettanomyces bruxellensis]
MDAKLKELATLIKGRDAKVIFFVGAGISTNCGIPDFRSPKTGLYSNLQKLNLPFPEAVFDINYFKKNPKAFYTLAEEMYPGKYLPSKFHYFIRLCQEKNILKRCYTQNIDALERVAGVHEDFIVEAHGSLPKCIVSSLMKKGIPRCQKCDSYVKPDIVFFGESLPAKFFELWEKDRKDDFTVAIVAGTSLEVYPFAILPAEISSRTTRVLMNREICADFEDCPRKSDLVMLADCDHTITKLVDLLGWHDDLEKLIQEGKKLIESPGTFALEDTTIKNEEKKVTKAEKTSRALAKKVAEAEKVVSSRKTDNSVDDLIKGIEKIEIKGEDTKR